MISIDIKKMLKTYKGEQILKIARQFDAGSITKIYGPSGAGKTTFLKIIAGFIKPEKAQLLSKTLPGWIPIQKPPCPRKKE